MAYSITPDDKRRNGQPVGWREKVAALRYVPLLIKFVWRTHKVFTITIIVLRLLNSLVPVAALWVGKLVIDTIVAAQAGYPDFPRLLKLVGIEISIIVAGQVVNRASSIIEGLLGDLFSNHISVRLMEHAATLDLQYFENPTFYDQLERARRQTTGRIGFIAQLLQMCEDALSLISLSVALLVYSPWLVLLLAVTVLPSFFGETHFARLGYSLFYLLTPERRKLDYLRYMGASAETAKEVQLFGLAGWIVSRFRSLSQHFYDENKKLSIRKGIVSTALSLVSVAGFYAAYVIILVRAFHGVITIGSLTFLAGSFQRSRDLIQRLLLGASGLYEQALFLKDLFDFFAIKPSITSPVGAPAVPRPAREGFVFEDVGFRYPDSDKWAVRHVNFKIRPGERVALVGENGAGKTTLTKLLARLYDVTEGRILFDGKDIREYDIQSVRQAIGVIFQDFVKYDLRFDENIGVGEIGEVGSYLEAYENYMRLNGNGSAKVKSQHSENGAPEVPRTIKTAADKSLASILLPRLPEGYRQMLGRRFDGGVELSGGEWQKVALARAYMRNAQVLILDEPTASLDARAEYEVFSRFSHLVEGRMAVIISHRFSTVRMADRIIVLNDGMIVEQGVHSKLVEQGGLYAELFTLQAEGYR
jgi:ATP-binding cassette, subfamily B, bacterial